MTHTRGVLVSKDLIRLIEESVISNRQEIVTLRNEFLVDKVEREIERERLKDRVTSIEEKERAKLKFILTALGGMVTVATTLSNWLFDYFKKP